MPLIAFLILCLAVVGCDKKVVKSVDVPGEDVFVEEALTEDVLANGGLVCSGMEMVRFLVEHGADPNAQNNDGNTALIYAAADGDMEMVRFLVELGADVNFRDRQGMSVLLHAAADGDMEMVRFLVERGADLEVQNNNDLSGNTALINAVWHDEVEIVRLLVELGADVNARSGGRTALSIAKENGNQEIIDLLEAAGATE